MTPLPDDKSPTDLADRMESALRALWQGDSRKFEQLLDYDGSEGPRLSDL